MTMPCASRFLLPQGGEFAFVLFTAAAAAAIFAAETASMLIAIVTLSMALTPLFAGFSKRLLDAAAGRGTGGGFRRRRRRRADDRLLALRPDRRADAAFRRLQRHHHRPFGRPGAQRRPSSASASISATAPARTCSKRPASAVPRWSRCAPISARSPTASSTWCKATYPDAKLYVRSYDRTHTLELRPKGVDYELRETFESGLLFGQKTLEALGMDE